MGLVVGPADGASVGLAVGVAVGAVGDTVGAALGAALGASVQAPQWFGQRSRMNSTPLLQASSAVKETHPSASAGYPGQVGAAEVGADDGPPVGMSVGAVVSGSEGACVGWLVQLPQRKGQL